jgi:predicted RNA binding protein YcfA (HicA-like mRNA interferase family)
MSRLPVCSGAEAVKAFHKIGYETDRQTGSHIILRHPSGRRLTVPNHRELAKGTLRAHPGRRLDQRAIHRIALNRPRHPRSHPGRRIRAREKPSEARRRRVVSAAILFGETEIERAGF